MHKLKITLDGSSSGFGNNGGTSTIFRSAETLAKLGHDVHCLAESNKCTWVKLERAKYVKIRPPKADVTIATGWRSAQEVMKRGEGLKLWWVRGWETWSASKTTWLSLLKKFPYIVVNSIGLAKRVKDATGRDVKVVYPGIDSDEFYLEPSVRARHSRGVGMLYSPSKATKNMPLTKEILTELSAAGYVTRMLALKEPKGFPCIPRILPTIDKKRKFYNSCDVWIAVSESEGLHLPPIEASLCGCALVCTEALYGGTSDYAVHDKTAITVGEGEHCKDPNEYCKAVELLIDDEQLRWDLSFGLQKRLKKRIGSRRRNMEGFIRLMWELL